LLRGGTRFFLVQWAAVTIASAWAFLFTLGMLWIINKITAVKVSELTEGAGLDEGIHGEAAYAMEV
jgi:Amt family ammonium transporter